MDMIIQAGFLLMAVGMGTVFASLAVFFFLIVLFEKIFKVKTEDEKEQA
jgi:Na+-transporting methylmalonyl-CoA/oxaloacetate decarboxylase gamma subunit